MEAFGIKVRSHHNAPVMLEIEENAHDFFLDRHFAIAGVNNGCERRVTRRAWSNAFSHAQIVCRS
jgi:hypothetical protein